MLRRLLLVMSVAALMAAMLVVIAGPASAQSCQNFGVGFVAENAPHGELASSNAPLNNEIHSLQAAFCAQP